MGNLFDKAKKVAFNAVSGVMGYDAVWNSIPGRVLFNKPDGIEKMGGTGSGSDTIANYLYNTYNAEYISGDFTGLYEAVRASKAVMEEITIYFDEVPVIFYVKTAERLWDGDNVKIQIEPKVQ